MAKKSKTRGKDAHGVRAVKKKNKELNLNHDVPPAEVSQPPKKPPEPETWSEYLFGTDKKPE